MKIIGETSKAFERRIKEGWHFDWLMGCGIDIGASSHLGLDKVTPDCDTWDMNNGDATEMAGVPNEKYAWTYSSHCLEHLANPSKAIGNWWRILKPGGYLVIVVPHRDLYEKRTELPSQWNPDHKWFWLPSIGEKPCTLGLMSVCREALGENIDVQELRILNEGFISVSPNVHSGGEYSIEIIIRKPVDNQKS